MQGDEQGLASRRDDVDVMDVEPLFATPPVASGVGDRPSDPAGDDDPPAEPTAPTMPGPAARRPPKVQRISSLPARWRWAVVAMIALVVVVPLAQGALALRDGWRPVGDGALIGMRARDVLSTPPTMGQPTTADDTGAARQSAHLGPLESYLLAPGIALVGPRLGLALGASLLNGIAWGLALYLGYRRGGLALLALVAIGMALLVRSVGPSLLHDPINSDVATIALVPLALAAWAVLDGDLRVTPVLVFLSAFVLQAHLANIAVGVVLSGLGAIGVVSALRRRRPGDVAWTVSSAALLVVLWLPPILHELGSGPSNVGAVWKSLWDPRDKLGTSFGIGRAATAVAPWRVPYFAQRHHALGPPGDIGWPRMLVGMLVLGLVGSLALRFRFVGRRSVARLLGIGVAVAVALVVTASSLPPDSEVRPEMGRPVWLLGLVVWVGLLWAAWWFLTDAQRSRVGPPVVTVLLVVAALVTVGALRGAPNRLSGGYWAMDRVVPFSQALRAELPKGAYVIEPYGASAFLTMAPALVLDLDTHGYRTYVPRTPFSRGYDAHHFYRSQRVRGRIVIIGRGEGDPPPGARPIVVQRPGRRQSTDDVVIDAYFVPGRPR